MISYHLRHLSSIRKGAPVLVCAAILALAASTPALAAPTGNFLNFGQCPLANPEVSRCIYLTTTGKEFSIGTTKVPINKTITFQGGTIVNAKTGAETFVGAANGETLSKTPLAVPGLPGVTATLELIANPGISLIDFVNAEGVALSLPLRIHLNGSLLGSSCYVSPVTFNLTTGTPSPPLPNEPIAGSPGAIEVYEEGTLLIAFNNKLVDNAFSEPAVKGCGGAYAFIIEPILN